MTISVEVPRTKEPSRVRTKGVTVIFCENAEDGTDERTNVAKYFDAKQISAGRYSKEEAPSVANREE